jgi:hypothetical protein
MFYLGAIKSPANRRHRRICVPHPQRSLLHVLYRVLMRSLQRSVPRQTALRAYSDRRMSFDGGRGLRGQLRKSEQRHRKISPSLRRPSMFHTEDQAIAELQRAADGEMSLVAVTQEDRDRISGCWSIALHAMLFSTKRTHHVYHA